MEKSLIFGRGIPMFDGRCPWIWLTPTSNVFNEDKLKIEGGILPDNLFEPTPKNVSFVNWPKEVGTLPPKLLQAIPNTSREDKFPIEGGILPIKLFTTKETNRSSDKVPRVAGISPSKRL